MNTLLAIPINDQLRQVETLLRSQVDASHSGVAAALYQMIVSGGKRLRPRIALLTGGMLGVDAERLVTLAASIEMLHAATLVHDDLIDNSLLRRGMATLNAHYSPLITVLAGDYIFARAARLASDIGSTAVMRLFAETLTIMTKGELAQAGREGCIASREEYFDWIHAKTASLFELATGAAAFLSPVSEQLVAAARSFGREIGMAFQIVDDILDFTGDQRALGKPTGSDLRQGVVTLPTLCYLESHPGYPISHVIDQWKKKKAGGPRLDRLITDICQNGAIHQARQEAEGFVQRGLAALASMPDTPERQALAEIARAIVYRDA